MKNTFLLISFVFVSNYVFASSEIINHLDALNTVIQNVSSESCMLDSQRVVSELMRLQEDLSLKTESESNGEKLRDILFDMRQTILSRTSGLSSPCVAQLKLVLEGSRALEDLVGLYLYKDIQITAESFDFQKQFVPLVSKLGYRRHHGTSEINFEAGDIMITKGVSYKSSLISVLPTPTSLFSHIVFVQKDETSGVAKTIESYIGKGVELFDMDYALKNENARILVLRQKDRELGKRANDYMMGRINKAKKENKPIEYDYALDFNDNKKLSCEEVAYDAFKQASNGDFLIPKFTSEITRKSAKLLSTIGIRAGELMSPADMESDPRFEIVYDWTDFRIMRDSWRKDAILSEVLRWMDDLNYEFTNNSLTYYKTKLGLSIRSLPGVGSVFEKNVLKITKEVPNEALLAIKQLSDLGQVLMKSLKLADEKYFSKYGMWMSQRQLREYLEQMRLDDYLLTKDPYKTSRFHGIIAPKNL